MSCPCYQNQIPWKLIWQSFSSPKKWISPPLYVPITSFCFSLFMKYQTWRNVFTGLGFYRSPGKTISFDGMSPNMNTFGENEKMKKSFCFSSAVQWYMVSSMSLSSVAPHGSRINDVIVFNAHDHHITSKITVIYNRLYTFRHYYAKEARYLMHSQMIE